MGMAFLSFIIPLPQTYEYMLASKKILPQNMRLRLLGIDRRQPRNLFKDVWIDSISKVSDFIIHAIRNKLHHPDLSLSLLTGVLHQTPKRLVQVEFQSKSFCVS